MIQGRHNHFATYELDFIRVLTQEIQRTSRVELVRHSYNNPVSNECIGGGRGSYGRTADGARIRGEARRLLRLRASIEVFFGCTALLSLRMNMAAMIDRQTPSESKGRGQEASTPVLLT